MTTSPLPPTPNLRIELLGVPRLLPALGKPHVLERRDAALLAWLALHGPTPRRRMVGLLWPDLPTPTAQTNLRQRLFRLKQRAGHEIVLSEPVLALARDVQHDLESTQPSLGTNAAALLGALDYEDCGELAEWVGQARERWQGGRRQRLAQHAAQLESEGRIAEALAFAERLTAEAPTAEHAHRRVMRLHYRRGDRSAALAAFERCREALARELGTRPGAETRELATLIERSDALPPPVAAPTPVAALRPPRLIGREREWRILEDAWQRRQPVLLLGEPGIGKSRLAADFAAAHGQAHVYRAHPGDARLPYSLLARLLRGLIERFGPVAQAWVVSEFSRLLPELGPQPAGQLEPLRLRQAIGEAIGHWQALGLAALVVDDLQFADDASLEWLLAWLEQSADVPIMMTARASEVPAVLRDRGGVGICEVPVLSLNTADVAALLDSLAIPELDGDTWAEPLARHTGGNPLFILETLKAELARPVAAWQAAGTTAALAAPPHIGTLLERRLAHLAPDALRLARVAALAGADFSAELAAAVLQAHVLDLSDAWLALEQAQVMRDGAFAHDLILEATLRSVPHSVAVALHRSMAQVLEQAGHAPARVAHHWQAAQEWSRAASQFERAAKSAETASRPVESLAAWNDAAACHRAAGAPDGEALAFECDWRAVRRLCGLGSLQLALARADEMLARATGERQRAMAFEARACVHAERCESDAALADAGRAAALAAEVADPRLELLATHQAASALMRLARPHEAIALRQDRAGLLHLLDAEEQMDWIGNHATALDYADRRIEALQAFDGALAQAQRLGRWDTANALGCNKAIALMYLNRLQDSTDAARLAIEHGRRAGLEPASLLMDDMNLAGNLRDLGFFTDFLRIAEALPRSLRDAGHAAWAINAENDLAGGYAWLGRHDLALKALSPLTDELPPSIRAARLFVQARLLRSRPMAPDAESPAELTRRAHALIETAGGATRSYLRLKVALELARDAGEDAAAQIIVIETEARQREQFMLAMHALVLRTEVLVRARCVPEAADAARELMTRCEHEGAPAGLYAPELWWIAHQALVPVDPGAADTCLRRAAVWIEQAARHQVPPLFQQSFLTRNPVNAAVRAALGRLG